VRQHSSDPLIKSIFPKLETTQQGILRQIARRDDHLSKELDTISLGIKALDKQLHDNTTLEHQQKARKRLLDSLQFTNMHQRRKDVQERVKDYGDTFSWILQPGQDHRFFEWLTAGRGIYWISGKPGSGKSSLMDYILGQMERVVATERPLVLTCFFWRAAHDPLMRNFEGLWRSLCYQILVGDRDLCEKILCDPKAPSALRNFVKSDHDYPNQWLPQDLELLFDHLLKHTAINMVLFLDGVDEFRLGQSDRDHENHENHQILLEAIQKIATVPNIKICCSSRPDPPFSMASESLPNLRVQDLTRRGIESFVIKELKDTRASSLAIDVIEGAEGVFLWAHIVVEALRGADSRGEQLTDLKNIIKTVCLLFFRTL
jgi:hypothetical protein